MLVLSRKTRQQIRIGDNITVTILLVKGQVVRVGIEAPRDVRVLRAELPVHEEAEAAPPQRPTRPRSQRRVVEVADQSSSARSAVPERSANERRMADAADRTSPGLYELRRRGSLSSSLTRPTQRGGMPLGTLFDRH